VTDSIAYPVKTREIKNVIADSTRWNYVTFRDDDIVVATYAKTGTTWTQQIVGQLVHQGRTAAARGVAVGRLSPSAARDPPGRLAAQKHRRFLKTHLPIDALVFSPKAKYLYVVRDGRDVAWSMHNHHLGFTEQVYPMFNNVFGREGDPLVPPDADVRQYFLRVARRRRAAVGVSFWHHVQGWYDSVTCRTSSCCTSTT
jgi:aryl sulfotransferase